MSKEMLVIVLGVWTVIVTQLGLPYHPWGVILFVLTGIAVAVVGFLLRGEALSRLPSQHSQSQSRPRHATFAESVTAETNEHKETITSLE